MKKLAQTFAALMTTGLLLSTAACGGSGAEAKDASDEAAPDEGGQKSLEKFEGNRMEKADEEE